MLLPVARLDTGPSGDPTVEEALAAIEAPMGLLDLGDPGTIHDRSTPRSKLPPYLGPASPTSGLTHEWGSPAGQEPDPG